MEVSFQCSEIINTSSIACNPSQNKVSPKTVQEFLINVVGSLKYFSRHNSLIFKIYVCSDCSSVKFHAIAKVGGTIIHFNHHLTQHPFNLLEENINHILFLFCENVLLTRSSWAYSYLLTLHHIWIDSSVYIFLVLIKFGIEPIMAENFESVHDFLFSIDPALCNYLHVLDSKGFNTMWTIVHLSFDDIPTIPPGFRKLLINEISKIRSPHSKALLTSCNNF